MVGYFFGAGVGVFIRNPIDAKGHGIKVVVIRGNDDLRIQLGNNAQHHAGGALDEAALDSDQAPGVTR